MDAFSQILLAKSPSSAQHTICLRTELSEIYFPLNQFFGLNSLYVKIIVHKIGERSEPSARGLVFPIIVILSVFHWNFVSRCPEYKSIRLKKRSNNKISLLTRTFGPRLLRFRYIKGGLLLVSFFVRD